MAKKKQTSHSAKKPATGRKPVKVKALSKQWDPLESTCRHASLSIL